MISFEHRVALVTGGGSGIGRAAALAFAKHGARVVVADLCEDGAESVAEQIRRADGDAIALRVDVSSLEETERMVAEATEHFGGLDISTHAAGWGGPAAPVDELDPEVWRRLLDVNLSGIFFTMKAVIPALLKRGKGAIVNVGSVAGLTGYPFASAYAASKHGVLGLTKSAALEYVREGIRINAVCPGYTLTPMVVDAYTVEQRQTIAEETPLGRMAEPEEVAAAILFASSDAASFMIGHALVVDGGLLLPVPDVV